MNQDMLEILIGKYIDGEITSAENDILQNQLEQNPDNKILLEQLQQLNNSCRSAIVTNVIEAGKAPNQVMESAFKNTYSISSIFNNGFIRFAIGLAAGLVLSFMIQQIYIGNKPAQPTKPELVAFDPYNNITSPDLTTGTIPGTQRKVDLISFTDELGNEWLVEGYRKNMAVPAMYNEGI
jgi:hypothetical protein